MKNCPVCNHQFEDSYTHCPKCGADYIEASINSIATGAAVSLAESGESVESVATESNDFNSDEVILQTIESELAVLDNLIPPTLKESFARMATVVWGVSTLCTAAVAMVLAAPILYIVAAVVAVLFVYATMRRNKSLSKGESDVAVLARIFEEDMSRMKSSFVERESVSKRLEEVRNRIGEAKAYIDKAHKANRGRIMLIIGIVALLFVAGVGALAYAQHQAKQAEAAYEAQPEWIKLREAYLSSEYNDEHTGGDARGVVIETMLEAGVVAEAEAFFFEEAMGKVGDYECALLIAKYYDKAGDKARAEAFVGKLSLRYGSDNTKIRNR